jgi:DNA-binding beta-propeller fold protein YncE
MQRMNASIPHLLRNTIPALAMALAACQPLPPPANAHLTAVDYWPEERMLFIAVPHSGAVDVLRVPESPRQGSLDFVDRLSEPGRHGIVRIAVDRLGKRLWVADSSSVYVYPLAPRAPAARISHGPPLTPPVTDLIVDADGNGYVFMGGGERIDRVAAGTLKAETWLAIGQPGPRTLRTVGERALLAKDGHTVLFRAPDTGNLLRVNLATREVVRLESRELDALDCAALMWSESETLTAVPCRGEAVAQIGLGPALAHVAHHLPSPL